MKRLSANLLILVGVTSCVTPGTRPRQFDAELAAAALQDLDNILTALVPIILTFL